MFCLPFLSSLCPWNIRCQVTRISGFTSHLRLTGSSSALLLLMEHKHYKWQSISMLLSMLNKGMVSLESTGVFFPESEQWPAIISDFWSCTFKAQASDVMPRVLLLHEKCWWKKLLSLLLIQTFRIYIGIKYKEVNEDCISKIHGFYRRPVNIYWPLMCQMLC